MDLVVTVPSIFKVPLPLLNYSVLLNKNQI